MLSHLNQRLTHCNLDYSSSYISAIFYWNVQSYCLQPEWLYFTFPVFSEVSLTRDLKHQILYIKNWFTRVHLLLQRAGVSVFINEIILQRLAWSLLKVLHWNKVYFLFVFHMRQWRSSQPTWVPSFNSIQFWSLLFNMYVSATRAVILSSQQFALEISFPLLQEVLSFYQYFASEWMLSLNYNKQKIKAVVSENCQ